MNDMTNDTPDDFAGTAEAEAQLTAFALGELSETDAAVVARRVDADPALRREVDAIRATADDMARALAGETGPLLTEAQRSAITGGSQAAPPARAEADSGGGVLFSFLSMRTVWMGAGLAAAACLAIAFLWPVIVGSGRAQGPVAFETAPARDASREGDGMDAFDGIAAAQGLARRAAPASNAEVAEQPGAGARSAEGAGLWSRDTPYDERTMNGAALDDATRREATAAGGAMKIDQDRLGATDRRSAVPGDPYLELQNDTAADGGPVAAGSAAMTGETAAAPPPSRLAGDQSFTDGATPARRAPGKKRAPPGARGAAGVAAGSGGKEGEGGAYYEHGATGSVPYAAAERSGTDPVREAMAKATTAFRAGEYDVARSVIQVELEKTPDDLALLNGMTRIELAAGRMEEAQRLIDRALSVAPRSRTFLSYKANMDDPDRVAALVDSSVVTDRPEAPEGHNRDAFAHLVDNRFQRPTESPLSTFSIDVDTASYAQVRRFIENGALPPKDAVRIEELINYFDYGYEPATGAHPFSVTADMRSCPWNEQNRLLRIGLRGRDVERDMRPATSLVFLIDVSGSMNQPNKLPLVKASLRLLIEHLTPDDRVAMVAYAGAAGLVLPSTFCDDREAILAAVDRLAAGGSTAGGAGIDLAYSVAEASFIEGGVNRVILCTDGDFNVGVQSEGDLTRLIEAKRERGVFLSVLGFGTGNFQDDRMEKLSNAGNGNFAYIDGLAEARKVLVEEMAGTLVTIAKDVKIQVEFNPAKVGAYRLIGYANRLMDARDFRDDTKDAGEIGAGHTVTALYEVAPPGAAIDVAEAGDLHFQEPPALADAAHTDEIVQVRLRYKLPDADAGTEMTRVVRDDGSAVPASPEDFDFAAAVAGFGMLLRDSADKGAVDFDMVLRLAGAETRPDANERQVARDLADRFIDQMKRDRIDLAAVFAQSLTSVDLTDAGLAATVDDDPARRERLDAALAACPRGENGDARIDRLRVRLAQGRMALGNEKATSTMRRRAAFVDLVGQARELSE